MGLILGALALLSLVGQRLRAAVGTNLAVGVCVGVAGTLGHVPPPDLALLAIGGAASVPAALIGARLTGRLTERALARAIAVVLLGAGVGTAAQALP